ncbi:DUF2383 domain-containing protein [Amedibacillus sp. YH-ame6]
MEQNNLVEEINQLLKGSHMGAYVFQDLKEKLKSKELRDVFDQILDNLHTHERALTALVISEHGDPQDSAGVKGTIADFMQSVKNMALSNDKEILDEAVKAMEMAIKAIKDFDEKHFTLKEDMEKTIRIMMDDYSSTYHMLHKFSIEYR